MRRSLKRMPAWPKKKPGRPGRQLRQGGAQTSGNIPAGRQTAAQAGASGAQIDSGSHLDSQLDLREKGELDALSIEEQGERAAYNQEVQAWNQRNAAQGSQARERQLRSKSSTDYLSLSKTLLNSAGRLGNNFDLFSGQGPRLP